jgi:hypothetical protein
MISMRQMNLPELAPVPESIKELVALVAERLNGPMPFPRVSSMLIAYMAWPDDEATRNWWMLVQLARLIAASGAKLSAEPTASQTLAAFESFGGLWGLADAADVKLQDELVRIQHRWVYVADVLQYVVDMWGAHLELAGGPSIAKAMDLTQRHGSAPTKTVFVTSWSTYRSVAHLIAASAWLSREAAKDRQHPGSILTPALHAPEVVLRLAASYQGLGLSLRSHGRGRPLLDPEVLWHVPVPEKLLPLPARALSEYDLTYLTTERRAPRKDGRPTQLQSE